VEAAPEHLHRPEVSLGTGEDLLDHTGQLVLVVSSSRIRTRHVITCREPEEDPCGTTSDRCW
jgi:hypothetical protein